MGVQRMCMTDAVRAIVSNRDRSWGDAKVGAEGPQRWRPLWFLFAVGTNWKRKRVVGRARGSAQRRRYAVQ